MASFMGEVNQKTNTHRLTGSHIHTTLTINTYMHVLLTAAVVQIKIETLVDKCA